jgi:hypothetical protein
VAISAVRERVGPERAISVVHTDAPDNDFTALTVAVDEAGNFGYRPLLEAMYVARVEDDVAARLATAPERMLIPLGRILNVKEGN